MVQFKHYPIHIVYSRHNQDDARGEASRYNSEARRLEQEAARLNSDALKRSSKQEYEWEKFVENTALTSEDSDPAYRRESDDYHRDILDRLKKIEGVPFGKVLLGLFKSDVYIVPRLSNDTCYCAQTFPLDWNTDVGFDEGQGDTYIWFNPNNDFKDDTLFHELIHAYRYSLGKFHRRALANNEYNTEEFLAHQMQNIYRSYRKLWLEFTYHEGSVSGHPGKWGTKEEIYRHFTGDPEFPMVLKHFVENDDFARMVSKLAYPDYNPFRDYKGVEGRYLRSISGSGIKSLPAW